MTTVEVRRTAWLDAGQDLLREGGFSAVKLAELTERLHRTTGSFYHHFRGMEQYREELAAYFGDAQPRQVLQRLAPLPPVERLRGLQEVFVDREMGPLHAAMREWATTNATAATAVRAADHVLLEFIADVFRDLGLGDRDARARAEVVFAMGVARVDPPWPHAIRGVDDLLEVLTTVQR